MTLWTFFFMMVFYLVLSEKKILCENPPKIVCVLVASLKLSYIFSRCTFAVGMLVYVFYGVELFGISTYPLFRFITISTVFRSSLSESPCILGQDSWVRELNSMHGTKDCKHFFYVTKMALFEFFHSPFFPMTFFTMPPDPRRCGFSPRPIHKFSFVLEK